MNVFEGGVTGTDDDGEAFDAISIPAGGAVYDDGTPRRSGLRAEKRSIEISYSMTCTCGTTVAIAPVDQALIELFWRCVRCGAEFGAGGPPLSADPKPPTFWLDDFAVNDAGVLGPTD